MHEITYPSQLTYFIAWSDIETFTYGIVDVSQVLTTGQPSLWSTLIEQEWHDKLLSDFNFTIPEEVDPTPTFEEPTLDLLEEL